MFGEDTNGQAEGDGVPEQFPAQVGEYFRVFLGNQDLSRVDRRCEDGLIATVADEGFSTSAMAGRS